jgi:hypothetical protein
MTLTRNQAALLAMLLDADGAIVSYDALGSVVGAYGVSSKHLVRQYRVRLRRLGISGVAVVPRRGLRMVGLPPDEALGDVLAMLDVIRRDGYAVPATWRRAA